jgi:hypothetical protein
MSLDGGELAKKLKAALADLDPDKNCSDIASKYQSTIRDYLVENIEIKLSYAGVIPGTPPVADPEPSFNGKLSFTTFTFLPAATKELFDLQLGLAIKGGLITNGDTANGITFPPLAFNPLALIVTEFPDFDPSDEKASVDNFMKDYCSSIIRQIKTGFISTVPSMGARATASSTGVVTMLSIA